MTTDASPSKKPLRDLTEIRTELDKLDVELFALFSRRQNLSHEVYAYKKSKGLPIKDHIREQAKLDSFSQSDDEQLARYGARLMRCLMDLSCEEQERIAGFEL